MTQRVQLGHERLSRSAYEAVVYGEAEVVLAERGPVRQARARLEEAIAGGEPIYSVTTGYGAEATTAIPADALGRMQENTIRSHAVGVGPPAPPAVARGMTLLMAAALARGAPALSPAVLDALLDRLARRRHPPIPMQGSQSASDLIPGAHLALELLVPEAGPPLALGPKDGSLVNNSAFSTALAVHGALATRRLVERSEEVAAMTLQAVRGHPAAYSEELVALRPHPGATAAAAHLRELLAGSGLTPTAERPHDPFSLRCLPQIHGAVRDALTTLDRTLEIEIGAVTDNPVITGGRIVSGGNFHGEPLVLPLDTVASAVAELAAVSQRRTQHLVVGDLAGAGTPAKLSTLPAERLGLLMLPSLAAALVSECRQRAQPAARESIPVDVMEDHVSMAALAARQLLEAVELARTAVAAELVAAAQALDFQGPALASAAARELHARVRERVAFLDDDRSLDVTAVRDLI